ncbi:thyroid receptor-interacting protein 11 [Elysia marginata]|uniref:Thyroid receptor-interacting protein 11 n=1 Tax=Elysia marginata TaxID=1093978 RepID=A0AAV4JF72_9GAST|nr:thyroid receptor-interacting protein 11 [Elysia marginata]
MSWIGGSLSSLTGQLSNLTKDILTEGTEEVSDPATELRLAHERLQQLDDLLSTQRQENDRLKRTNRELEEKAEGSELQINTISREYRTVLEGKEREVNTLKHQNQELLEQQARAAAFTASSSSPSSSHAHSSDGWDSLNNGATHRRALPGQEIRTRSRSTWLDRNFARIAVYSILGQLRRRLIELKTWPDPASCCTCVILNSHLLAASSSKLRVHFRGFVHGQGPLFRVALHLS